MQTKHLFLIPYRLEVLDEAEEENEQENGEDQQTVKANCMSFCKFFDCWSI